MARIIRSGVSAATPETSPQVHVASCSGAGFHQLGTASYAPLRSSPPFPAVGTVCDSMMLVAPSTMTSVSKVRRAGSTRMSFPDDAANYPADDDARCASKTGGRRDEVFVVFIVEQFPHLGV